MRDGPPAYDERVGSQGTPCLNDSCNPDFVTVPTNFLSIKEENPICDNYTIDTSLQPIHMSGSDLGSAIPLHRDDVHHLSLHSVSGCIETKIRLVGSNRETAVFNLETNARHICVSVIRSQQEFVLKVKSVKGSLKIRIPRKFNGPIKVTASSADRVQFSDEMKKQLMPLGSSLGDGLFFLGPGKLREGKPLGPDDWTGDKVNASSEHGSISFAFEDEPGGSCVIQ